MKFIMVDEDRVVFIHHMPFDPKDCLGKTEEELLEIGYLVESIPEAEAKEGKIPKLHYTAEKGLYYEYVDAPNPYGIPDEIYTEIEQDIEQATIDSIVQEVSGNEA